jgi:hypothetical protein
VGEEVSVVAALDHYCIVVALDCDSEEQTEVGALAALAVDEAAAAADGWNAYFVAVAFAAVACTVVACNYFQGRLVGTAVVAIVASEFYWATPSTLLVLLS